MEKSILEVLNDSAKRLYEAGLMDEETKNELEDLRLLKVEKLTPKQIKMIRIQCNVSQPVFAAYLNVSASSVKKWEVGDKTPRGASLKLLNIVAYYGIEVLKKRLQTS